MTNCRRYGVALVPLTLLAGACGLSGQERPARPAPAPVVAADPYDHCIAAATTPGPSGFAPEVCESLLPDFRHGARIELGIVETTQPDGTVTQSPPLAEDIADSCRDEDFSAGCIRSVIDAHRIVS